MGWRHILFSWSVGLFFITRSCFTALYNVAPPSGCGCERTAIEWRGPKALETHPAGWTTQRSGSRTEKLCLTCVRACQCVPRCVLVPCGSFNQRLVCVRVCGIVDDVGESTGGALLYKYVTGSFCPLSDWLPSQVSTNAGVAGQREVRGAL